MDDQELVDDSDESAGRRIAAEDTPVPVARQIKRRLSALKHGAYSATTILPGESLSEFEKLHQELILEWKPAGAFEDATILSLAHLLWRKRNLSTFRIAERARRRMREIQDATFQTASIPATDVGSEEALIDAWQTARSKARRELRESYLFVELGEAATFEGLAKELAIQDRLDALIERCMKRLALARGLKSMSMNAQPTAPTVKLVG